MKKLSFSIEQFILAVKTNISISATMKSLGYKVNGTSQRIFKRLIEQHQISTKHFLGQGYLRDKNHNYTSPTLMEEIFNGRKYNNSKLRKRLIAEGYFPEECSRCKLSQWCNQKIVLSLEHMNGNSKDNRLENLTILCLNCHSLTETFRNKKRNGKPGKTSKYSKRSKQKLVDNGILKDQCLICGISEWQGEEIILELDHIDGNHYNNDLSNLRLLCLSCHAQTPTYCSKNRAKTKTCMNCKNPSSGRICPECSKDVSVRTKMNKIKKCLYCETLIGPKFICCKSCYHNRKKLCRSGQT